MKCSRCGGIMVYEKLYYKADQLGGWRCLFCGDYIDRVIQENRKFLKATQDKSRNKKEEPIHRSHSSPSSF